MQFILCNFHGFISDGHNEQGKWSFTGDAQCALNRLMNLEPELENELTNEPVAK